MFGTGDIVGVLHGLTDLPLPVLVLNLSWLQDAGAGYTGVDLWLTIVA